MLCCSVNHIFELMMHRIHRTFDSRNDDGLRVILILSCTAFDNYHALNSKKTTEPSDHIAVTLHWMCSRALFA